jgi:hypothetical protein
MMITNFNSQFTAVDLVSFELCASNHFHDPQCIIIELQGQTLKKTITEWVLFVFVILLPFIFTVGGMLCTYIRERKI